MMLSKSCEDVNNTTIKDCDQALYLYVVYNSQGSNCRRENNGVNLDINK